GVGRALLRGGPGGIHPADPPRRGPPGDGPGLAVQVGGPPWPVGERGVPPAGSASGTL
ncbi:MAG: hypothetical protein AVDCRST_MAG19-750, partial [uncultured Thermomicrobiales bacterium]